MEGMTNEQFKIVLNMIIQIIKDSDTKEEAIKKVEALVKIRLRQTKNISVGGTCHHLLKF